MLMNPGTKESGGIRPEYNGISINPCIPSDRYEFTATRNFRGMVLNIRVLNPAGVQSGILRIRINDQDQQDPFIPVDLLSSTTEIEVELR